MGPATCIIENTRCPNLEIEVIIISSEPNYQIDEEEFNEDLVTAACWWTWSVNRRWQRWRLYYAIVRNCKQTDKKNGKDFGTATATFQYINAFMEGVDLLHQSVNSYKIGIQGKSCEFFLPLW